MKKLIKLPVIVLGLMLLFAGTTQRVMAQDDDISLQSFYDELSPYGTWIQDPQYGYVWRPDVEQGDFRPYYTNGRWVMTEYGNTWVSNYDWGWAPFHYGRWVYNNYRQWIWIPDTVWGPAWVSWRSGGGYYGWAPMSPGININISFGIPDAWWVFVPQRNIYYDSYPRYYSRRNVTIIQNTTIINNTYERNRRVYYTGPRVDDIRRATRQDVQIYNVNRSNRPGRSGIQGNQLNVYNPRVSRSDRNSTPAPRTSVRGDAAITRFDRQDNGGRGDVNNGRTDRGNGIDRGNIGRNGDGNVSRPRTSDRGTGTRTPDATVIPDRNGNVPVDANPGRTGRSGRDGSWNNPPADRGNGNVPQRQGTVPPDVSREGRTGRSYDPGVRPAAPAQTAQPAQPAQPQFPREGRRFDPPARPQQPERMPQPQQQPQRQESRPQPQMPPQRMERPQPQQQQAPPPSRSSEGRSGGGERSSEGGRSSRSGRG